MNGWVATAAEQVGYVEETYEKRPDKVGNAAAAAVTNVAGDWAFTEVGAESGALIGAMPFLSGPTFGASIAIGAVVGGVVGHLTYSYGAKPHVKDFYMGDY